jgi:hypothetical protein
VTSINPIAVARRRLANSINWRVERTCHEQIAASNDRLESIIRDTLKIESLEQELHEVRSHLGLIVEKSINWENDAHQVRQLRNDVSELRITITEISRALDAHIDALARRIADISRTA